MTIAGISTPRLYLRAPRRVDASAIATGLNNFNVTRFLTKVPFPFAASDALDWMSGLDAEHIAFVVIHEGDGVIGVIGLENELGYWFAEPFWGQGYATEAAGAALDWYFSTTGATAIASGAHEDNPASLNVQKKLGFEITGSRTDFCRSRNHEVVVITTLLTQSAFARRGILS